MEQIIDMEKAPEKTPFKEKINKFFTNVFSSSGKTILFMTCLLSAVMAIYFLCILIFNHNFYNNWSDDSLQYYPIMCDFIDHIKHGNFSLFSYQNYLGASFFSDTYYIPLDGFTFIIFILSFVMNTEIAMSIVELLKLIAGAVALTWFLTLKGKKNTIAFLIGMFYFSSSGITCFSCFPSFTTLAFYLPFSLVIGHFFLKGKWYFVPLFVFELVLWNFYLDYMVCAFMCFSMLAMLFMEKTGFKKGTLKLLEYVGLILLGLMMCMAIFLPSMNFIMASTSRDVASGGSIKGLVVMFKSYIDCGATAITCFFKMGLKCFTVKGGIFNNRYLFSDSFIQLRHLYHRLLLRRTVNDITVLPSFFNVEEYFRMAATTFTPLTPSSFYGFQGSYFIEHISFYITGMGLVFSTYIWFMNDYKSKVYKAILIISVIMMLLPFFSYIYSANLEVLYTRWFNVISIPLLLIDAHVLSENDMYSLKPKKLVIGIIFLAYIAIFASYHTFDTIRELGVSNEWNEKVLTFENMLFYLVCLAFVLVSALFIALHYISKINKKVLKRVLYPVVSTIILGGVLYIGITILLKFLGITADEWVTSLKNSNLWDIEDQMAYQYMIFLTLLIMVIGVFFLVKKWKKALGVIFAIEFAISGCLSFGACVMLAGRETTFNNTHNLSYFLEENIDDPSVYRIYVDSSIPDVLRTNLSRMIPTGCNTDVFHSFIYSGTDDVGGIIYNKSDEGQASKKALNTYSYYLNVFLGYRYVVANPSSSFSEFDENQFDLVARNDDYILLEFKDYQEFLVYDNYVSKTSFDGVKSSLKDVSRIKFMLNKVIVDEDYLELLKENIGDESTVSDYTDEVTQTTYNQKTNIDSSNKSYVAVDGKYYCKYDFTGIDEITTRSYAINLFNIDDEYKLVANSQIYIENEDGSIKYLTTENIRSINGSVFHIPVYGGENRGETKPKSLYVYYGTDKPSLVPSLRYTVEAIIPQGAYIESYEKGEPLPPEAALQAAVRFPITTGLKSGLINVSLHRYGSSTTYAFDNMFIEYTDGSIRQSSQEVSIDKEIRYIYIVKTNEVMNDSTPPQIKITSYSIDDAYSDKFISKSIKTKGSKLTLSYISESAQEGNRIIVIPTAYSEEWEVVSGNVIETFKANGGFIGLIVPKSITSDTITLRFNPKGFELGLQVSALSIVIFITMVSAITYKKRKRMDDLCQL